MLGSDLYTMQCAERGNASSMSIKPDEANWTDRFKRFRLIKLCHIVPDEPTPCPSCVGRSAAVQLKF